MSGSRLDLAAGLSSLSSGVLATVAVTIGDAFPEHVKQIVAVAAIITLFAGIGTRLFGNPSPPALPKETPE